MGTFESSWGTVELCDIYHTKRSWGDMLGSGTCWDLRCKCTELDSGLKGTFSCV